MGPGLSRTSGVQRRRRGTLGVCSLARTGRANPGQERPDSEEGSAQESQDNARARDWTCRQTKRPMVSPDSSGGRATRPATRAGSGEVLSSSVTSDPIGSGCFDAERAGDRKGGWLGQHSITQPARHTTNAQPCRDLSFMGGDACCALGFIAAFSARSYRRSVLRAALSKVRSAHYNVQRASYIAGLSQGRKPGLHL